MNTGRKYYIDNLRWLWIVNLVPFHAAMAWNCWEGNYLWFHENRILSSFVIFVAQWYMPLLFILAGMSSRYALQKRSNRQFIMERIKKLAIPLITGVFTVVALMTYFADKFHTGYPGNFLEHYSVFLTKITDLTGYDGSFTPGHLWFLLYLFIISLLFILVVFIQKKIKPDLSFGRIKTAILPFLILFPIILSPVLDFGGKSIGEDFAYYLLGYYILAEEDVLERIMKYRNLSLILMLISDAVLTYLFVWQGDQANIIETICQPFSTWFGILAFLGIGRRYFNQNNKFTRYMSSRSFMFYLFHFGWLVVIQYYLSKITESTLVLFGGSVMVTIIMTLVTCEIVKKTPGVRMLFGEKK